MMKSRLDILRRFALVACFSFAAFPVLSQDAQQASEADEADEPAEKTDPLMEEELSYAQALIEFYPDYADPVIQAARKRWADAGPRLTALEMRGKLRLGKFDEVKAALAKVDRKTKPGEYWAMNLSLGDAYYSQGDMKSCAAIYDDFFKSVPKPDKSIRVLYIESAYKWGQMLIREGKEAEAAKVYDGLISQLKGADNRLLRATVQLDNAELLLKLAGEAKDDATRKGFLDRAAKHLKEPLWMDDEPLIFGRAVAMRAHVEVLRGKLSSAKDMVETYIPQLKEIHESLKEQDPDGKLGYLRQSPMPQCRYLLASMMWKGVQTELAKGAPDDALILNLLFGEKNKSTGKRVGGGAYNHAVNVAIQYPESTWASAADELERKIRELVKTRFKKEIKTAITAEQRKKILQMKFKDAHELFGNNDFAAAAPKYEEVLAAVPETTESVRSVGNLITCWRNMVQDTKDPKEKEYLNMKIEAAEGYISERFGGLSPELQRAGGDQTLIFAAREHDSGALARAQRLYDNYFQNYPTHHQAAQMAMSLASQAFQKEDYETAMHYYEVIVNSYTNSPYYVQSLGQLSTAAGKLGNNTLELDWLRKYAARCTSPSMKANAQLRLAYAQHREGMSLLRQAGEEANAEAAGELRKKARENFVQAAREFIKLVKDAEAAAKDPSVSATDKANFEKMREDALYLIGDSIQRMPAEGNGDPRAVAAQKYNDYLAAYPKGKFAPTVLMKLGTIYIATTNTVKQQEVFQRLERDFPESDEAKNSKPRLAKTLMDMGLTQEAVKQYAEMVGTDAKYTSQQLMQAGEALLEGGGKDGLDTAIRAFDKSIARAGTNLNMLAVIGRCKLGKGKALMAQNRLVEAQELMRNFMDDKQLGRTTMALDANMMLIEAASKAGERERDDDARETCFRDALAALQKVKHRVKGDARKEKELALLGGDILLRRMHAEEAMKLEEQMVKTRGSAIASYRGYIMGNKVDEQHPASGMQAWELSNLEHAYACVLPLIAAHIPTIKEDDVRKELVADVNSLGGEYLELFPNGKHKIDVQNAMNLASAQQ